MLRMCVYMHSRFVENHPIRILEDRPLISEGVLSQAQAMPGLPPKPARLGMVRPELRGSSRHDGWPMWPVGA
jgi:hypothetical protein